MVLFFILFGFLCSLCLVSLDMCFLKEEFLEKFGSLKLFLDGPACCCPQRSQEGSAVCLLASESNVVAELELVAVSCGGLWPATWSDRNKTILYRLPYHFQWLRKPEHNYDRQIQP